MAMRRCLLALCFSVVASKRVRMGEQNQTATETATDCETFGAKRYQGMIMGTFTKSEDMKCQCPPGTSFKAKSSTATKFKQFVGLTKETCLGLNSATDGEGVFNTQDGLKHEAKGVKCRCVPDVTTTPPPPDCTIHEYPECGEIEGHAPDQMGFGGNAMALKCKMACDGKKGCKWERSTSTCAAAK